jgi:hypothetical protein
MQDLTDLLVEQLGVNSTQAQGGAALLFRAARDKLGAQQFSALLGKVPGIDGLVSTAPAAGGLGRLFGGLAAAVGGGNAAILAGLVSGFGQLGLTQSHAQRFVPVILDYLRRRIGDQNVSVLEKTLKET